MGIHIACDGDVLDVLIDGVEKVLGLRKHIELPVSRLLDIRVESATEARADLIIRTGGTAIPGVMTLGHFRGRRARRQWWRVYRASDVLVLDLSDEGRFDRVVLEVDDPEAMADELIGRCEHLHA